MGDPSSRPIVLVAMGGHAFMQRGEAGDIRDHERNAAKIGCMRTMASRSSGPWGP